MKVIYQKKKSPQIPSLKMGKDNLELPSQYPLACQPLEDGSFLIFTIQTQFKYFFQASQQKLVTERDIQQFSKYFLSTQEGIL